MKRLLAALTLGWFATACGYTSGVSLGPERERIGVEIFANDSRVADLERMLHAELTRATRAYIDAELVRPSQAQVILRGRIDDYRTRGGVRDKDNRLLESGVEVRISGSLVRPNGKPLTRVVRAATWVGFTRDRREAEEEAVQRALANLADRLILDLATASQEPAPEAR